MSDRIKTWISGGPPDPSTLGDGGPRLQSSDQEKTVVTPDPFAQDPHGAQTRIGSHEPPAHGRGAEGRTLTELSPPPAASSSERTPTEFAQTQLAGSDDVPPPRRPAATPASTPPPPAGQAATSASAPASPAQAVDGQQQERESGEREISDRDASSGTGDPQTRINIELPSVIVEPPVRPPRVKTATGVDAPVPDSRPRTAIGHDPLGGTQTQLGAPGSTFVDPAEDTHRGADPVTPGKSKGKGKSRGKRKGKGGVGAKIGRVFNALLVTAAGVSLIAFGVMVAKQLDRGTRPGAPQSDPRTKPAEPAGSSSDQRAASDPEQPEAPAPGAAAGNDGQKSPAATVSDESAAASAGAATAAALVATPAPAETGRDDGNEAGSTVAELELRAVEALMANDRARALQAYAALVSAAPNVPVFATMYHYLARAQRSCTEGEPCPE